MDILGSNRTVVLGGISLMEDALKLRTDWPTNPANDSGLVVDFLLLLIAPSAGGN